MVNLVPPLLAVIAGLFIKGDSWSPRVKNVFWDRDKA